MTALELISFINRVLFIGLFVVALRHAVRSPTRPKLNIALFFGAIAAVVVIGRVGAWTGLSAHPLYLGVVISLLALAPVAMIRLIDDFSRSPRWLQPAGLASYALLAGLALVAFGPMEQLVELAALVFFLLVGGYAAIAFARAAAQARGITRRRMTAVSIGAGLFIGSICLLLIGALAGGTGTGFALAIQLVALASVVAFYLGFAPPAWIRRAWREPDLRRFLEQSLHLASVEDEQEAVRQLNAAAATALGARGAQVGIADAERGVIRYASELTGDWVEYPADRFVAGRAFQSQQRVVMANTLAEDPANAEAYARVQARAAIASPISTETRRIGVLTVFAERMSVFAEDDFWLVDLLADQIAVLLEARELAEHASSLRAREEAARLKEEFLSAAAHDLRTPLTVVLGQAELLERRQQRNPTAPVDAQGLGRIVREARRLSDLVTELLDAQRLEQGTTVMDLAPADLLDVLEQVRERYADGGVTLSVDEPSLALVAAIDRPRMEQVLDNLVDNALKYTPSGPPPEIRVSSAGGQAWIEVVDHGIGIPPADRPRIFERFFRASNAQSITDTGIGLGLYICRRVVDAHGGEIRFESTPGGGTTFVIALPLLSAADPLEADRFDTRPSSVLPTHHEAQADA
jgi:signal transduction histidine kinase